MSGLTFRRKGYTDPFALVEVNPYRRNTEPPAYNPVLLIVDFEHADCYLDVRPPVTDMGTPADEYYRRVVAFDLGPSNTIDATQVEDYVATHLLPRLQELAAVFSVQWDGNNHVGVFDLAELPTNHPSQTEIVFSLQNALTHADLPSSELPPLPQLEPMYSVLSALEYYGSVMSQVLHELPHPDDASLFEAHVVQLVDEATAEGVCLVKIEEFRDALALDIRLRLDGHLHGKTDHPIPNPKENHS